MMTPAKPITDPLTSPELPAIPGLTLRPYRGGSEIPQIAAVINASLAADGSRERITADELASQFAQPADRDPQQHPLLAVYQGEVVGCAYTARFQEADATLHAIHLQILQAWRGCGLEQAMQAAQEKHARAAAAAGPSGIGSWFTSKVPDTWPAWSQVLQARGYYPTYTYFEMQRSLLGDDLPETIFPPGLALRPVTPAHYRPIWEADEECFQEQRDYVAPNDASYAAWVAAADQDAGFWLVAWEGDQIAGAAINSRHEGAWAETDDLFVRRPWRRRGLGRALMAATLQNFKAIGLATAGVGVDAGNLSGVLGLYESLGYRPYQRLVSYRKTV